MSVHVPPPMPEPSWRKPVGMLMICGLIAFWAFVIASASGAVGRLPGLIQLPIYLSAGIVWILPLKPLLSWMETGSWRWGWTVRRRRTSEDEAAE